MEAKVAVLAGPSVATARFQEQEHDCDELTHLPTVVGVLELPFAITTSVVAMSFGIHVLRCCMRSVDAGST